MVYVDVYIRSAFILGLILKSIAIIEDNEFNGVLVNDERTTTRRRSVVSESSLFRYRSYAEIVKFINNLKKQYPKCVNVKAISRSYEGRKLYSVVISRNLSKSKPKIMVDALVHAREWVAGAMMVYLLNELAESCINETSMTDIDWILIPVVNPDGYEFTRKSFNNRLWRKTRSVQKKSKCRGVDGNRNYDFHWGESGVSEDICEEIYPGNRPFSEPETRAVAYVMERNKRTIKLYCSLHAYGEYLVYPFGYAGDELPDDWKKMDRLAKKASAAIVKAGGKEYNVTSSGKWYPAAGGSDDYAYGYLKIPYSYTMELTDKYGFNFPENKLKNYLSKIIPAFKLFAKEVDEEFSNEM